MPDTKHHNSALVFHFDLYGERSEKYDFLNRKIDVPE
jgi:hypothetical protein